MTKVTYTPLENGDPIETSITGSRLADRMPVTIKFSANKPVDVPDDLVIDIIERVVSRDKNDIERGMGVERKIKLSDHLRANPYFHVEGTKQAAPPQRGKPRLPQKAEEYRSWAQAWFATSLSPDELGERWQAESEMRERLGVHDDGDVVRFLRPFYEQRFEELKKAAA
jgi:hypothetical protein